MDLLTIVPYYTAYLCAALRDRGIQIVLGSITYHWDPECFARQGLQTDPGLLDIVGRRKFRPMLRRGLKLLEFCVNMLALLVRFRVHPPDVLHVQFLQLLEQGLPFEFWFCRHLQKRGVKLVYTVHNILPLDTGDRHRQRYARVYRAADALICHTSRAKKQLIEEFHIDPRRIWVVPHGPMFHDFARPGIPETRQALGFSSDDCVVSWHGIVSPYKGLEFLLDTWQQVQAARPNARLYVAGSGEARYLAALEDKVRALGIGRTVRLDFRFVPAHEIPSIIQAADILVYPYREITQSGALLTGLTFGKAIVATDLPPFRETLAADEAGLLVPYGDIPAFAGALIRLVDNPSERARLAAKAAALAISWSDIAAQTDDCYRTVLGPVAAPEEAKPETRTGHPVQEFHADWEDGQNLGKAAEKIGFEQGRAGLGEDRCTPRHSPVSDRLV
jgi:glycosyltransferase involved in cell wall biosynthesis